MRVRTISIAALVAIAVLAIAISLASRILIGRFDAIEAGQSLSKAGQAVRAFEADLNQLAVSTRDYAEWDDAQDFVATHNPEFLRANFSFDSLDGMQVDVMALLDRNGTELYSASINANAHELHTGAPAPLIDAIRRMQSQVALLRKQASSARLLSTPAGLLAFSILDVSRSDHTGANGAVLFFGRFIEADEIARIRQTSQLPLQLSFVGDAAARRTLSDSALRHLLSDPTRSSVAEVTDSRHITGFAAVRDWTGAPQVVISVPASRDIGALGRRTTAALMGTIAALILICTAVLLLMLARLRRHWAERLELKNRQERILACLGESIALADLSDGRIIEANDALLRTLDYDRSDLQHLTLANIYIDLPPHAEIVNRAPDAAPHECRMRARDGHVIDAEINTTLLNDADRRLICIVARDLSYRRQAEQSRLDNQNRLAHLAEHDALTGLPNRVYLHSRLPAVLRRVAAEDRSLALMYLDLDHFKNINDSNSHALGDEVLRVLASRIRQGIAAQDMLLRMGGDEFVVVAELDKGMTARDIGQRLLALVREPIEIGGLHFTLTASIGIAMHPQDSLDAETLLKHSDIALFQAKEKGRNCCQVFATDMNTHLNEHVVLEQALRRAINTDQIRIEYQPVIDLHTGLLVSFEALARWHHPELGSIPPSRFIPVAEKSGLIVELGAQIVRDVIVQLRSWRDAGLTPAPVAINVAPIQFERTEFAEYVHETAMQYDVDLTLLAFEVTESALMQDSAKHIVMMDTLRHAGSRVYIDDFGTGFSNLSYLKNLPVDAVKIDQSFVRNIMTDQNDVAIVSGIIAIARQLRLQTIAEGIETAEQADKLRGLGCILGQGYYFSKPMPASHCQALLEQLGAARQFTETVRIRAFRHAAA